MQWWMQLWNITQILSYTMESFFIHWGKRSWIIKILLVCGDVIGLLCYNMRRFINLSCVQVKVILEVRNIKGNLATKSTNIDPPWTMMIPQKLCNLPVPQPMIYGIFYKDRLNLQKDPNIDLNFMSINWQQWHPQMSEMFLNKKNKHPMINQSLYWWRLIIH